MNLIRESVQAKRNKTHFAQIYDVAQDKCKKYCLQTISLPRNRRSPKTDPDKGAAHEMESHQDLFKVEYCKMLDTSDAELADRFHQPGIHSIHQLKKVLLSGSVN